MSDDNAAPDAAIGVRLEPGEEIDMQWNYVLILLSYALSVFGAWTAFMMIEQSKLALKKGQSPTSWAIWAAIAMGGCGMNALNLGIDLQYEPRLVVVSVVTPIAFVIAAFLVTMRGYEIRVNSESRVNGGDDEAVARISTQPSSETTTYPGVRRTSAMALKEALSLPQMKAFVMKEFGNRYIIIGALLSGTGIVLMHYTGMLALQFQGRIVYYPWVVFSSCLIAIVASAAALVLLFLLQSPSLQIISALVMGVAVCGMHYIGMQVKFLYDPEVRFTNDSLISKNDIGIVVAFTAVITCFLLESFGASRIKNAKLRLDNIVRETKAELTIAIQDMVAARRTAEHAQDMLLLINAMRPTLHEEGRDVDEFIKLMVAITGRRYDPSEVSNDAAADNAMDVIGDRREALHALLVHPVACELLKDKMLQSLRLENVLFYRSAILFADVRPTDRTTLVEFSKQIVKRYIHKDAFFQINLSNQMRNRILERCKKPDPTMFDEAKNEVFRLIMDNDFLPFLSTREGRLALWLSEMDNAVVSNRPAAAAAADEAIDSGVGGGRIASRPRRTRTDRRPSLVDVDDDCIIEFGRMAHYQHNPDKVVSVSADNTAATTVDTDGGLAASDADYTHYSLSITAAVNHKPAAAAAAARTH